MLNLINTTVEYLQKPIGIESKKPRFSWILTSDNKNTMQETYKILVFDGENIVWDSKKIKSSQSVDVIYNGEELKPTTTYTYSVEITDNHSQTATIQSSFETGFMDGSQKPWLGAKWIGQEKPSLCAVTKGVFAIESKFKILGSKAGIVFGADDDRLNSLDKNIMGLEGENKISYEIDVSQIPAKLIISRVGYAKDDIKGVPFCVTKIVDVENKNNLPITEKNKNDWHTLRVEVYGNIAKAFVDGVCVDAVLQKHHLDPNATEMLVGRQLNPLGANDTITFPTLNKIGFSAPHGEVEIEYLNISDLRAPQATLFSANIKNVPHKVGTRKNNLMLKDGQKEVIFDPSNGAVPIFRKEFTAQNKVNKARLYITSRGIYDAVINGENASGQISNKNLLQGTKGRSDKMLLPGASQFDKHLFYNAYDITDKLVSGNNAIAVIVSSGWWSDSQTFALINHNYYGDRPSFMAKIVVEYVDGQTEIITTDTDSWKLYEDGPIIYSGYFAGERYDATKEELIDGYDMPNFDDSSWSKPVEVAPTAMQSDLDIIKMWPQPNHTQPELVCHVGQSVEIIDVIEAVSVNKIKENIFVYDMGQNMAGVPYIKIKGEKGQKILIRFGEILYPHLEEYGHLQGTLLTENLRDAQSNDLYICKGDENGEIIFPRFTFHGYRYVEINGLDAALELGAVKGVVISSFVKESGYFNSNNENVNRLYQNILWSQKANFISIPTDCPQRNERMGWMGDAQVFAPTSAYNDDVRGFFERYLVSVRDLQNDKGQYPCIAPVGGGFGGIAWESAGIIIPWVVYTHYADARVLEDNFDAMLKYVDYLKTKIEDDVVVFSKKDFSNLGDWLATDLSTDGPLIWNSLAIYDVEIAYKSAEILGETEKATELKEIYNALKTKFNEVFFDASIGKTKSFDGEINDTQCSYALPLSYGIFNEENQKLAAQRLNEITIELDYTLTTGFVGTPCIAPALTQNGYSDTAYKLLCQTKYPSWLYPVTQGATTIWERWNSYTVENGFGGNNAMNSFNHYSLGAVGYWLYSSVLGIKHIGVGFKELLISPEFNKDFSMAEGFYNSEYGKIRVVWKYEGEKIDLELEIPANSNATVLLPMGEILVNAQKIQSIKIQCEKQQIKLGSGVYKINITEK